MLETVIRRRHPATLDMYRGWDQGSMSIKHWSGFHLNSRRNARSPMNKLGEDTECNGLNLVRGNRAGWRPEKSGASVGLYSPMHVAARGRTTEWRKQSGKYCHCWYTLYSSASHEVEKTSSAFHLSCSVSSDLLTWYFVLLTVISSKLIRFD